MMIRSGFVGGKAMAKLLMVFGIEFILMNTGLLSGSLYRGKKYSKVLLKRIL